MMVTVVLLKNRRYAALYEFAPVFGYQPDEQVPGTSLPGLDFVGLAQAQGVPGVRVDRAEQLQPALMQALQLHGPMLVEVEVA
jgi:benzoylformate decarboxylase